MHPRRIWRVPALAALLALMGGEAAVDAGQAPLDCSPEECRELLDRSVGEPVDEANTAIRAYWITRASGAALERLAKLAGSAPPSGDGLFDPALHTLAVALVEPDAAPRPGPPVSKPVTRDWGNQYRRIFIHTVSAHPRFLRLVSIEAFPSRMDGLMPPDTVLLRFRRIDDEGLAMITRLEGEIELELPMGEETRRIRFSLAALPAADAADL